jgi:predicted NUDIX family NTP pyrophosphohydrolase
MSHIGTIFVYSDKNNLSIQLMNVKVSAGLLLYKFQNAAIQFFLVHPGGPFFVKKDEGWWTVPKGEVEAGEDELESAKREFLEETGSSPEGAFILLDPIKQKGGKIVKCWAIEADIDPQTIVSNSFEIEWPPQSGKKRSYPEVDRADWFTLEEAKKKINARQIPFLEQLLRILSVEDQ